ncbi:MAG TPA: universal stress protein [Casimicrobiaceae bacterium]
MKVLFATDGSAPALAALKSLLDRRAWFAGEIELTVLTAHHVMPFKRAAAWAGHDALKKYYDEECDASLAPAVALLTERGVAFKTEKRIGEPATTIVAAGVDGGYDLLALGAQGHSAFVHLMLGSVAAKVVAASRIPVLLLR